jgi:hypothetical protein
VPFHGIYRRGDLVAGEAVLIRAGLLELKAGVLIPAEGLAEVSRAGDSDGVEVLVITLLASERPAWLLAATAEDDFASELVPDREMEVIEKTLDPDRRELLLLGIGQRYSAESQEKTGALAEDFVVDRCRKELVDAGESDLAEQVQQVSSISDQLGYDITAPRPGASTRRIECKGTKAAIPRIYLSRNEAKRALCDPDWYLVVCTLDKDDNTDLSGWCPGAELEQFLPVNQGGGQWASVEIPIPEGLLRPGLPPIDAP